MKNVLWQSWSLRFAQMLSAGVVATLTWNAAAQAAECTNKDALGTSRTLEVDAATTPRVGLKSFPQTLPLRDHEVVLTFDDGPWPATTSKVLKALANECVLATFFLIGKPASEHRDLVRKIAAAGHSIGTHTWTHPDLAQLKPDDAVDQINHGISAVETVLHGTPTTKPSSPFFRFPGFSSTPATLDLLQSRGIVVFGADLWASDWNPMTPEEELKLLTGRLTEAGNKGLILLPDLQKRTADMVQTFLQYLKDNHFHVVHLVPAAPGPKDM